MKKLATFREDKIFKDLINDSTNYNNLREAVRVIVLDQIGKIALVGTHYFILPGGGVEKGETLEDALARECLEEIGCQIKIENEIGMTEDYRPWTNGRQFTYCYVAKLVGEKGKPQSTHESEKDNKILWVEIKEALKQIQKYIIDASPLGRHSFFNLRSCDVFLKEYLNSCI